MNEYFQSNDKVSKVLKSIISILNPEDENLENEEVVNDEVQMEPQEGNLLDIGLNSNFDHYDNKTGRALDTGDSKKEQAKFSFIKKSKQEKPISDSFQSNQKRTFIKEKTKPAEDQSTLSPDDIFGMSSKIGNETPSLFDNQAKNQNLFNNEDNIQTFDLTQKSENLDDILNNHNTNKDTNDQDNKLNKVLSELNKNDDLRTENESHIKETITRTNLQISNPLIEEQINLQYKQFKSIYGNQCADEEIYNYAVSVVVNNPLIQRQLSNSEGYSLGNRNQPEKIVLNKDKDFDSKKVYDAIDDKPKDSFGFVNDLLKKKN